MRLPRPTLEKLKDVVRQPAFRQSQIQVICRIINWQFFRVFNQQHLLIFDESICIKLYTDDDDVATRTYYFDYYNQKYLGF